MKRNETNADPAALALSALGWTLGDAARAGRLLALTGLTPDDLRLRLSEPELLAESLRFLEAHEPDLLACAGELGVDPQSLVRARQQLEQL